jgi:hypothetical protein
MPQFTCYAQFDRIRYNLLKIVKNKYDLLKPMDISMFKIWDKNAYYQFHRSKDNSIGDYL